MIPTSIHIHPGEVLTFGKLFNAFPAALKELGPLHFRFKVADKEHGFAYQDAVSFDQQVPSANGIVHAKVLVVSKAFERRPRSQLTLKASAKDPANAAPTRHQAAPSSSSSSTTKEKPRPAPFREEHQPRDSPPQRQVPAEAKATRPAPTPQQQQHQQQQQPRQEEAPAEPSYVAKELNRAGLAAAREQEVQDRVDAAKEFKAELDDKSCKETAEFDAAKEAHDARLTAWATQNSEKKNVRSLMTSMHTVLWDGHRWKQLGLGDVIDAKKVKLHYRKAMLVVHPDRCSNRSVEVRFIAKRIFEAVNEAYQDFLKKEGVEG